jgi:ABC-2 type transport system ATP-binding protein
MAALADASPDTLRRWQELPGVTQVRSDEGGVNLLVTDPGRVLPLLFEAASAANGRITSLSIEEPDLEMVFLHLTGRALRD